MSRKKIKTKNLNELSNSSLTQDLDMVIPNSSVSIEEVHPTVKDLMRNNTSVTCSEENCDKIFSSISNLNMHLYRTHMQPISQFDSVIKNFHCPEVECSYHEYMHFTSMKLLRQHYQKVHLPKSFICEKCKVGFPTKVYKKMHVDYCGVKFQCSQCPMSYPSYESLLTHARRKAHKIKEKICFKLAKKDKEPEIVLRVRRPLNSPRVLLPKPTANVHLVIIAPKVPDVKDQCVQTDPIEFNSRKTPKKLNKKSVKILKDTRQTQTTVGKIVNSIETQTNDLNPKSKNNERIQSSTQTFQIKQELSNEIITENTLPTINIKQESSESMLCSSVADHDTDSSDLNLQNFDSNLFNCNMETQTDFIFNENEDLFEYCDFYNNMCTQTCSDLLLDSLEFNDIETQTADEILTSVGSQTVTSLNKRASINTNDTNHVETQTDAEFQKILESMTY